VTSVSTAQQADCNTALSTRVGITQQGVGEDLAQQLQRAVRDEMRRVMDVR